MRILVSNDDGIMAPGLRALAAALQPLGEVWVVAPDKERSAASHSISLHKPLRAAQIAEREFAVSGTPTDSVYLALNHFMPEPPDVVVSGINRGANLGNDVLYSGTVSAAMEGALFGFPAIAVSLCIPEHLGEAARSVLHWETATHFVTRLVSTVAERSLPTGSVLNVNVPNLPTRELAGAKLCRLGYTDWADAVTVREDPRGRPYYWVGGARSGHDDILDSDNNGIAARFITVTPIHYDLTDYRSLAATRKLSVDDYPWQPDTLGSDPLPHPTHPRSGGRR